MNRVRYDNLDLYEAFGMALLSGFERPLIEEVVENQDVELRRGGSLTIKTGIYKDIIFDLEFRMIHMDNYDLNMRKVRKFFDDATDKKLIFSDCIDRAFAVKDIKVNKYKVDMRAFCLVQVQFICEPFMINPFDEIPLKITSNSATVENFGDVESYPLIKCVGIGNTSLTISGKELQVSYNGEFTIDTEIEKVVASNGTLIRSVGNFPVLKVGANTITKSNLTSIEIIKNERFKY